MGSTSEWGNMGACRKMVGSNGYWVKCCRLQGLMGQWSGKIVEFT